MQVLGKVHISRSNPSSAGMATTKTIIQPLVIVLALTMLVALAHGSFFVFKINVFKHCMGVIKKDPPQSHDPSKKCKKVVEDSNLVGICSVLTEQDEQQISVERLLRPCLGEVEKNFAKTF